MLPNKEDVLHAMDGRFGPFYSQYTELKMLHGELRGRCPIHSGDGPNFAVNPETGEWFCHSHCGGGGDVFSFVERMEGLAFPDALNTIADFAGVAHHHSRHKPLSGPGRNQMKQLTPAVYLDAALADECHARLMSSDRMCQWLLEARGLTLVTLQRYHLGLDQHPDDKAAGVWRITFPVFDRQGRLLDLRRHLFAYKKDLTDERRRKLGKTKPWKAGLRPGLFPLSALYESNNDMQGVLLVEGEADAALACQMGFKAVTGTGGAGTWREEWTEAVRDNLKDGESGRILYDHDEVGEKGGRKAAQSLARAGVAVRLAQYPEGVKDFTAWILAGATTQDIQALVNAAPFVEVPPGELEEAAVAMPHVPPWPKSPKEAFYGLAGEFVRTIEPHTEADLVSLLIQLLVAFGSAIGRGPHFLAEADKHRGSLFVVLVGVSSKGRKGSSWGHIRRLFQQADPEWENSRVMSGLSSGEGLIYSVRDAVEKEEKDKKTGEMQTVTVDGGVADKRLLVNESEFASVLKQTQRDGNTLSPTLRNAWDGGKLQTMTKNNATQATEAHVSIIGHITRDELRKDLAETETANGFGNRFLWVCVKRSKELPDGGHIDWATMEPLVVRLREALSRAKDTELLKRDDTAREIWHAIYHDLSTGKPGLLGAMTGRAEAQTMRLALLYALLDSDTAIRAEHLTAALSLWEYCEASARYIFGDSLGDRVADDILHVLRSQTDGLSRSDLRDMFGRNQSSGRMGQALALLQEHGLAHPEPRDHDRRGRPSEVWKALS